MRVLSTFIFLAMAAGAAAPLGAQPSAQPLTLDAAIRLALEKNQDIKVEAYAPEIARANVLTALGQFDPALTLGRSHTSSYEYPDSPQPLASELIDTNTYSLALVGLLPTGTSYSIGESAENERGPFNNFTNNYEAFDGVNITQPLLHGFGFGANLVGVRVAKANRSISRWDYRQQVITSVAAVVTAYSNLVLAHDRFRADTAAHDIAAALLDAAEKRFKAHLFAKSDVIVARATLAESEDAVLTAARLMHTYENQLRELTGETSFSPDNPLPIVEQMPAPEVTVDLAKDVQTALSNRPDYQAARLGIVINRAYDAAARNQLLPQVNFVGGYGYAGLSESFDTSRRMVADRLFPSRSAGLEVSIPLTFSQGRGQARAARLTLEQSEAYLKDLEANIALAVTNDIGQIETAQQRVTADRIAYGFAQQELDAEVRKLRDGKNSPLNVVQAQQSLTTAELTVATAESAERLDMVIYETDLGTILNRYHIDLTDK